MMDPTNTTPRREVRGERGASRLSFLIVVIAIGAAAYTAYQVVPVVYRASLYKDYVRSTVNKGVALGKDQEWVKQQLTGNLASAEYGLPTNTKVETKVVENRMVVHVQWARDIKFPGYVYRYDFDYTARSDDFFNPK